MLLTTIMNSAYERNASEPFPDRQSPCLGFCLGEISAFTMSISQSLLHVVEIAPAAVLAAFKIGLIASQARESIEPKCGLEESWTMAVDKAAGIDGTMLEKFHNQKVCPGILLAMFEPLLIRSDTGNQPVEEYLDRLLWAQDNIRLWPTIELARFPGLVKRERSSSSTSFFTTS